MIICADRWGRDRKRRNRPESRPLFAHMASPSSRRKHNESLTPSSVRNEQRLNAIRPFDSQSAQTRTLFRRASIRPLLITRTNRLPPPPFTGTGRRRKRIQDTTSGSRLAPSRLRSHRWKKHVEQRFMPTKKSNARIECKKHK